MIDEDTALDPREFAGLDCVLVDEAQFLPPAVIEDLRRITVDPGVPVICYGLRTDFRTKLFPGAQRLMELADAHRGGEGHLPVLREEGDLQPAVRQRHAHGARPADPARRRRDVRAGVLGSLRRGDEADERGRIGSGAAPELTSCMIGR